MSVAELKTKNRDSQAPIWRVLSEKGIDLETEEARETFERSYFIAVNGEIERDLDRKIGSKDQLLVLPLIVGG